MWESIKEPILDYVTENDEKKNSGGKGLKKMKVYKFVYNPFSPSVPIWHHLAKFSIIILEWISNKNSYERADYESVD